MVEFLNHGEALSVEFVQGFGDGCDGRVLECADASYAEGADAGCGTG